MDKFVSYECHDFYISVNYKAEVIKNYFDFLQNPQYKIHYFQEEKPMGTAGSLRLLKDKLNSTFSYLTVTFSSMKIMPIF